jgi:penicillin-binding protein 1A
MEQLGGYVNLGEQDLSVRTTLDLALQGAAERGVATALAADGARLGAGQAALAALAPDGAVRAMVGGRAYPHSQFNRATQALRQPGSAFKPFVYLAGLESGLGPETVMRDTPISIDGWRPRNYGDRHYGEVTLREAMARSINTVAVQVSERVGRGRVIEVARRLGLTSTLKPHPSLALGAGEVTLIELTAAYAALANRGEGVWAYAIEEVRDGRGRRLYRRSGSGPGRVIDGRAVGAMHDMLGAVMAWGTGKAARLDRPAAGKTGTSQDFRDAWFIGYTADLVAGVWVGNDDAAPMRGVTGGGLPARLWKGFMTAAHAGKPARALRAPADERRLPVAAAPSGAEPPRDVARAEGRRPWWERALELLDSRIDR